MAINEAVAPSTTPKLLFGNLRTRIQLITWHPEEASPRKPKQARVTFLSLHRAHQLNIIHSVPKLNYYLTGMQSTFGNSTYLIVMWM